MYIWSLVNAHGDTLKPVLFSSIYQSSRNSETHSGRMRSITIAFELWEQYDLRASCYNLVRQKGCRIPQNAFICLTRLDAQNDMIDMT